MKAIAIPYDKDCGGWHGNKTRALYIPGKVFVDRNGVIYDKRFDEMYTFSFNEQADEAYQKLVKRLGANAKPQEIDVPDNFIDFAKAVQLANNPPKEIYDVFPETISPFPKIQA